MGVTNHLLTGMILQVSRHFRVLYKGHYITNPKNALTTREIPQQLPYICIALWIHPYLLRRYIFCAPKLYPKSRAFRASDPWIHTSTFLRYTYKWRPVRTIHFLKTRAEIPLCSANHFIRALFDNSSTF